MGIMLKQFLAVIFVPFWMTFVTLDITIFDEFYTWDWDENDNTNFMCRLARWFRSSLE